MHVAYIPDRHWLTPSWMHDFAATDKYAVLIEQPLYMVRRYTGNLTGIPSRVLHQQTCVAAVPRHSALAPQPTCPQVLRL